MASPQVNWYRWYRFFARRRKRPLPKPDPTQDYVQIPESLAASLAIFQLGESGGGTIVGMLRHSHLSGVTSDYANAVELFVKEENRHADILAICVKLLGGNLIRKNWTANLFVFARRLLGVRLKIVVLLAAEVVGLCYYHLLASRLPACQVKTLLEELVDDEHAHLYFHCQFLRSQASNAFKRWLFVIAWRATMITAVIAVMIDHRAAIRDMGLGVGTVWRRWMSYSRLAEQLVTGKPDPATCFFRFAS